MHHPFQPPQTGVRSYGVLTFLSNFSCTNNFLALASSRSQIHDSVEACSHNPYVRLEIRFRKLKLHGFFTTDFDPIVLLPFEKHTASFFLLLGKSINQNFYVLFVQFFFLPVPLHRKPPKLYTLSLKTTVTH